MKFSVRAQLAVFVSCVLGFVVLVLAGKDPTAFAAFVTPVLGAVFVVSRLDQRSDAQDSQLAQITHQTNGVLSERIKTAVAEALAAERNPGQGGVQEPG